MALDFPASPSNGQTYSGGGTVWQWDGAKWTSAIGAAISIVVGPTPPAFQAGVLWWDNNSGQLFVAYDDGNSQQWVVATNMMTPTTTYAGNVGRNLIHNSMFAIAQRGVGPFALSYGYTLDRWGMTTIGGTASLTQAALTDADRAAIGDENARYALQNVVVGGGAAGDFDYVWQPIEDIRRTANKTVIISFWARATAGTPKLGFFMYYHFGSGGSPSAGGSIGIQTFTLSTTWTRYTTTAVAVPSIAGKTFGTDGISVLQPIFCQSSGATGNAGNGAPGVQSYTLQLWGVQLEIVTPGQTQPTPLEKRDPVYELQQCQRFYQVGQLIATGWAGAVSQATYWSSLLPVALRSTTTTVTVASAGGSTNVGAYTGGSYLNTSVWISAPAVAVGAYIASGTFTISADL